MFRKLFRTPGPEDESSAVQLADVQRSIGRFASAGGPLELRELPVGTESVVGGLGAFGWSLSNPVPVNGPVGQTVYLNRLRTDRGSPLAYHRLETFTDTCGRQIDGYEVVDSSGSLRGTLYFDMYYIRRSLDAPDGLRLVSWSEMGQIERSLVKIDHKGVRTPVPGFPSSLGAHIAKHIEQVAPSAEMAAVVLSVFPHEFPSEMFAVGSSLREIQAVFTPGGTLSMPREASSTQVRLEAGDKSHRTQAAYLIILASQVSTGGRSCALCEPGPEGTTLITVAHGQRIPAGDAVLLAAQALPSDPPLVRRLGAFLEQGECQLVFPIP